MAHNGVQSHDAFVLAVVIEYADESVAGLIRKIFKLANAHGAALVPSTGLMTTKTPGVALYCFSAVIRTI